MVKKVSCRFGRLASPVRSPATGSMRRCKLKKKTATGRSRDRRTRSREAHEIRYRRDKRLGKR